MSGYRSQVALLCVAQFVIVLDVTIVAVALPAVQRDLGFSTASLQWVVSAYTLAFGGLLMLAGRAGDVFGRRRLFVLGLVVFTAASLACALAPSQLALVVARTVQGAGAAMVAPAALALLTATVPEGPQRVRALAVWTAAAAAGGASGWVLGGAITAGLGWEWVFLVNLPLGIAGVLLASRVLAESSDPAAGRLDPLGAVVVTAGLALLAFGLTEAALLPIALGLVLLAAFLPLERRVRDPLVPPGALRPQLVRAALVALAITASTSPAMFLCVLYVQQVEDVAPAAAGLLFAPLSLAVVAGSLVSPRLGGLAMPCGLAAVAAACAALLAGAIEAGPAGLLAVFAVMGTGLGAAAVASTDLGTRSAREGEEGLASGLLNTTAQVGTALGIAALVPLAERAGTGLAGYRWAFAGATVIALLGLAASVLQPVKLSQRSSPGPTIAIWRRSPRS